MTTPRPGYVTKHDTGISLGTTNDVVFSIPSVSGTRFFHTGDHFVLSEYDTNNSLTEVNLWACNGSVATNFRMDRSKVLDVCYDTHDGVYYAIRWNYDDEFRSGGYTFPPDNEGGSEYVGVLFMDDFVSSTLPYRREIVQPLEVETRISSGPPVTVSTASRKWTDYSRSFYTGRSTPTTGWNTATWGSAANFDIVSQSINLDMFQIDTSGSGALVFYSNLGQGYVDFDVSVEGDFVAYMDVNVSSFNSADAVIFLRALMRNEDRPDDPYNEFASIGYRGPSGGTDYIQVWTILPKSDTAGVSWTLSNMRINERYLDAASSSSETDISFTTAEVGTIQVSVDDFYTNTPTNTDYAALFSTTITNAHSVSTNIGDGIFATNPSTTARTSPYYGETYRSFSYSAGTAAHTAWANKFISFDVRAGYTWDPVSSVLTTAMDDDIVNSSRTYEVTMTKETRVTYAAKTALRLAIKRVGTTLDLMVRDNSKAINAPGGAYVSVYSYDCEYSGPVRFEIFGDAIVVGLSPSVSIDKFVVRDLFASERSAGWESASTRWAFPVLTVETFDSDGSVCYKSGITDGSGRVVKSLDVIKSSIYGDGSFGSYYGKVRLATDHDESGGELYISVNSDFYKYEKMNLPITTDSGSLADQYVSGEMFGTPKGNTLCYNKYTGAGLIYVAENDADPGDGLYVNCIRNETMTANDPHKYVWIEEADSNYSLYTVDVNQFNLLYGLSTTDMKVYLYDLDEYSAAFCNVISDKQIMGAGTSATAAVAAQVVNVYGEPLQSKSVTFSVSSGDGAVSPSTDTTDSSGEADTTYTVGDTVGTAVVTATVTN